MAARYFVRDADSFEGTEEQLRIVADMILDCSYMTHKENVRIVAAQSFATLIPLLSTKDQTKNLFFLSASLFETYLTLMTALIYIITDENPQIRLFMQNQSIQKMLGNQMKLKSVPISIDDANDTVLLQAVFMRVTD